VSVADPRILVLGLGNDILADDAIGLLAAQQLRAELPEGVRVLESASAGLDLLDLLADSDCALLLDAVLTGRHPPGTILEFTPEALGTATAPSPHFAGIPDLIALAARLQLPFPHTLRILACEIEEAYTVREGLTSAVAAALPAFVARAREVVSTWLAAPPRSGS
jgi:hydrogenase maturation protease